MRAPHRLPGQAERAWRELVCDRFVPLGVRDLALTGRDRVDAATIGAVHVATVRSGPQTVLRSGPEIANGGAEHLFLNLQLRGTCEAEQRGRALRLRPGDVGLFDAGAPYRLRFGEAFAQRVLHVPRAMLATPEGAWRVAGRRLDGAGTSAPALRAILAALWGGSPSVAEAGALARAAFLLAEAACPSEAPRSGLRATRARATQIVARDYGDPDLTVDALAARLGCSVRHLHAAFAGSGTTAAQAIWTRRLRAAAARLRERTDIPVAIIGWDCGFRSPSHFAARFRRTYGISPRAWRRRGD